MKQTKELTQFLWRTMDGRTLTLAQMETKHIFNSMKMIFNHIAEAHGGHPVWFTKKYSDYARDCRTNPKTHAETVAFFIFEIDRRGDLPEKYQLAYQDIKNQIVGIKRISNHELTRKTT